MKSQGPQNTSNTMAWIGKGNLTILPPPEYWAQLANIMPGEQIERLKEHSNQRFTEFTPSSLGPPEGAAFELLTRFAADGWVEREVRYRCPRCEADLSEQDITAAECPHCREVYSENGSVEVEYVFVRHLAPIRSVDWVVAIHGMNTSGAWQEAFTWTLSTTWGRSVPVAVYKYGIVVAGVVMAWRRRRLQHKLRNKLAVLRDEARAQGYDGNPDVIAHSFGTWLFGHMVQDELARNSNDRLRFGRIILLGCILRPDFDWKSVKEADLVQDVLNHYGTGDRVVPLAHATISDSGPSGSRGFDSTEVINIRADAFGHSDLLSIDKKFRSGVTLPLEFIPTLLAAVLTLPREELLNIPDRVIPPKLWCQFWWPLRGTIFPFFALPFVVALMGLLVGTIGNLLWRWSGIIQEVALVSAYGIGTMLVLIAIRALGRWLRG